MKTKRIGEFSYFCFEARRRGSRSLPDNEISLGLRKKGALSIGLPPGVRDLIKTKGLDRMYGKADMRTGETYLVFNKIEGKHISVDKLNKTCTLLNENECVCWIVDRLKVAMPTAGRKTLISCSDDVTSENANCATYRIFPAVKQ